MFCYEGLNFTFCHKWIKISFNIQILHFGPYETLELSMFYYTMDFLMYPLLSLLYMYIPWIAHGSWRPSIFILTLGDPGSVPDYCRTLLQLARADPGSAVDLSKLWICTWPLDALDLFLIFETLNLDMAVWDHIYFHLCETMALFFIHKLARSFQMLSVFAGAAGSVGLNTSFLAITHVWE